MPYFSMTKHMNDEALKPSIFYTKPSITELGIHYATDMVKNQ